MSWITERNRDGWHVRVIAVEQQRAQHMSMAVGKIQAAIWRTEEAIELQRMRIAEETDPRLASIEWHSLVTLEDILDLHRRTLDVLIGTAHAPTCRAAMDGGPRNAH